MHKLFKKFKDQNSQVNVYFNNVYNRLTLNVNNIVTNKYIIY